MPYDKVIIKLTPPRKLCFLSKNFLNVTAREFLCTTSKLFLKKLILDPIKCNYVNVLISTSPSQSNLKFWFCSNFTSQSYDRNSIGIVNTEKIYRFLLWFWFTFVPSHQSSFLPHLSHLSSILFKCLLYLSNGNETMGFASFTMIVHRMLSHKKGRNKESV